MSTTSRSVSSTLISDASTSGSNVRSSMTAARMSSDLPIFLIDSDGDRQLLSHPQSIRQAGHWESGTGCCAIDARYRLPLGRCSGMCKNLQVETDRPAVAELMADAAAAVARRGAAVSEDVYDAILQEIPQLRDDKPVLTLLASSVDSNVDTCLQIMQHRIDLAAVQAPAAATEYARRLAQRGTPLTALLRAYRLGHARFSDWVLRELAQQAGDAYLISAAALGMSGIVAGYIDQVSEEMVAAYTRERENWLLNRSAARGARIRHLLSGEPV